MSRLVSSISIAIIIFHQLIFSLPSETTAEKTIETTRTPFLQVSVGKQKDQKPSILVINNKAWDVETCKKRILANKNDGDALFILGSYYLICNELGKARIMFEEPELLYYTAFSKFNMLDYLGLTYYKLGELANKQGKTYDYIETIKKQQSIFNKAIRESKNQKIKDHFVFQLALLYIDIARLYEEKKGSSTTVDFPVSDILVLNDAKTAYEQALQLLTSMSDSIANSMHVQKALSSRLFKKDMAPSPEEPPVKTSVYAKQRNLIVESIENNNDLQFQFTDDSLRQKLLKVFVQKYRKGKPDPNFDEQIESLKQQFFLFSTSLIYAKYSEIQSLPQEEKDSIYTFIQRKLLPVITDSLFFEEQRYVYEYTAWIISNKRYAKGLSLITNTTSLFSNGNYSRQLNTLKKVAQDSMRQPLYSKKNQNEQQLQNTEFELSQLDRIKQSLAPSSETSGNQANQPSVAASKQNNVLQTKQEYSTIQTPSQEQKKSEILSKVPESVIRVGLLIDEMIEKKDYIGAYRGLHAYEKTLKSNFGDKDIENTIKGLEKIIERDFGQDYLLKLKKELNIAQN